MLTGAELLQRPYKCWQVKFLGLSYRLELLSIKITGICAKELPYPEVWLYPKILDHTYTHFHFFIDRIYQIHEKLDRTPWISITMYTIYILLYRPKLFINKKNKTTPEVAKKKHASYTKKLNHGHTQHIHAETSQEEKNRTFLRMHQCPTFYR